MRLWVAEINEHAVAHVSGDEAIEFGDDFGNGAVIGADDLTQIFGIEPRGELGRADQIAEHHCQLAAFRLFGAKRPRRCRGRRRIGRGRGSNPAQSGNCSEQFAAVAPEHNPEVLQVLCREFGQYLPIDLVVAERGFVPFETQAAQPHRYIHQASPSSSSSAAASLSSGVSKPSLNQA